MHRTLKLGRRTLANLAILAGMLGGPAVAQPPTPAGGANQPPVSAEARIDKATGAVLVPLGSSVRYTPSNKAISDVFIPVPDVVSARLDTGSPRTLILTGMQPGTSGLDILFDDKTRLSVSILVQPDYELLKTVIRRAVPTANVDVVPGVGNVIILTGYVSRPEDSDTIQRIASSAVRGNVENVVNALQVGGAMHVLIDVTVAQVDRTELRQRGTAFGVNGTTFGISSILPGLGVTNVAQNLFTGGAVGAVAPPITPAGAQIVVGIVPAGFIGALQALKTEGLAKFLSEPKVITQSGRPAFLRSGGQQAVLGPAAGINGPGAILEQIGTELEVLPLVFGNGKIYLEVNPRFRSVNNARGLTTAFGFTPGFNEQQTRSSVLMESGQTFAIGGLLETEIQATADKIPYLGDIPVIGSAFSRVTHSERETELIVLVTPHLVDALDCNQAPRRVPGRETRTPDDYELFLEQLIEAPRGQRRVWDGRRYVAAYKNDPTAAEFPCAGGSGADCTTGCATPTVGGHAVPVTTPAGTPTPAPVVPVVPASGEVIPPPVQ